MTIGALLDPVLWDLKPGLTPFGTGLDLIGQRIRQGLQIVIGEWILDREAGAINQDWMRFKPVDEGAIEAALNADILDTDGVVRITESSTSYTPTTGTFVYTADVETEEGEITLQVYPTGEPATTGNRLPYAIVLISAGGII